MDGMLGLGPDDPSNGPSFVAEIANQGIVTHKMFGLIMSQKGVSEITFGGYDETWMKYRGIDIDYFPQTNATRWEIELRDVKMMTKSFWQGTTKAVIDSFYKVITLPTAEFSNFATYIQG